MIYSQDVAKRFDNGLLAKLGGIIEREHRKSLLAKYDIDLEGKSVYINGCGTGREIGQIEEDFKPRKIDASDSSKHMIKVAKSKFPDLDLEVRNACNLNGVASDNYDFVNCSLVLDHVRYYGNAVKEMFRITKPGGYIFNSIFYPHKIGVEDEITFKKVPNEMYDVMVWYRPREAYRKFFSESGTILQEVSLITNSDTIGMREEDFRNAFNEITNYSDSHYERKLEIDKIFDQFHTDDMNNAWGWTVLLKKV
jgi:ubiquinone/menaquinone biosynthesis C-methylase UbiE